MRTTPPLTSKEQTVAAIARLGETQRELQRIEADMNDEVSRVVRRYHEQIETLKARIGELRADDFIIRPFKTASGGHPMKPGKIMSIPEQVAEVMSYDMTECLKLLETNGLHRDVRTAVVRRIRHIESLARNRS
jgi:hypothetical protein